MSPRIRSLLAVGGSIVLGVIVGRLLLPRLEPQSEITAIVRAVDNHCFFATSTTESILAQPRYLLDGGKRLECGERWPLSDRAFIYCECD